MLLRYLIKKNDYRSHLCVGQIALGLAGITALLGLTSLLDPYITPNFWLGFTKGIFFGISLASMIMSLILGVQALRLIRNA